MDLFQPVTLFFEREGEKIAVAYANLRLAVLSVMRDLTPGDREKAMIRGRDGEIDFSGIVQLFEDLRPRPSTAVRY